MELVLISGRSGSGKSSALNVLEDVGYNCIDNLPVTLLPELARDMQAGHLGEKVAICIDARNALKSLQRFPDIVRQLPAALSLDIVYLDAQDETLSKRFSETRRKHPLTSDSVSLMEAIRNERELLDPIINMAQLNIDTTGLSIYELRDQVKTRVSGTSRQKMALLFMSFGFKHGVPHDADLVYDVRCLPNPYWDPALRKFSGLDEPVQKFLHQEPDVHDMIGSIEGYLDRWLPAYEANNRSYLTIAIGCTGGQHRSVFIAQHLGRTYRQEELTVQVRHRELKSTLS
ncbi:RNase adapter RapZ [Natronospirillum operosum]|uniref:RNase adapter RapZ n=1 Tax=Natronospirillum operosum TaxID=2759953 RepID=A0A4Z0W585_9GAMM|nr:RNase adapter RapZ [Natronospirillum operosum]TGG90754.1 RNase adapter RapZ [Natronospirillum operosum]